MISLCRSVALSFVVFILGAHASADDSQWVRAEKADGLLVWDRPDGIVFGLPSPPVGDGNAKFEDVVGKVQKSAVLILVY